MGNDRKRKRHVPTTGRRTRRSKQQGINSVSAIASRLSSSVQGDAPVDSLEKRSGFNTGQSLTRLHSNQGRAHATFESELEKDQMPQNTTSVALRHKEFASVPYPEAINPIVSEDDDDLEEHEAMEAGVCSFTPEIDEVPLPDDVLQRSVAFLNWRVMGGLAMVCGTTSMSIRHYESVRRWISWGRNDTGRMRGTSSYSHLQKNIFPFLRRFSFPDSNTHNFEVNPKKSGAAQPKVNIDGDIEPTIKEVKLVPISQWMRRDMCSGRRFKELCIVGSKATPDQLIFDTIENCPIIRNREAYTYVSSACFTRFSEETGAFSRLICEGAEVTLSITDLDDEDNAILIEAGFDGRVYNSMHVIQGVLGPPDLFSAGTLEDPNYLPGDLRVSFSPLTLRKGIKLL